LKGSILYGYIKRSNLSFVALHIGHISGGASLAHKYPQTLHRQTGYDKDSTGPGSDLGLIFLCSTGGRRSGIAETCLVPLTTAFDTYSPQ
jgi:hypothetical protein